MLPLYSKLWLEIVKVVKTTKPQRSSVLGTDTLDNKMETLIAAWSFDTTITYFIVSSSHIQSSYDEIILVDSAMLNSDLE